MYKEEILNSETNLKIDFTKEPGELYTQEEVEQLMQWSFHASRKTITQTANVNGTYQKISICKYSGFREFLTTAHAIVYGSKFGYL